MVDGDALKSIEKLHDMKISGIISDDEFQKVKQDLLSGKKSRSAGVGLGASHVDTPASDDHVGWALLPLKRYADFSGRTSRREFWMFQLIYVALFLSCAFIMGASTDEYGEMGVLGMLSFGLLVIALIGMLVPLIAAQVRRLHDQEKSGWFALFNLLPYIGPLIVYALMLIPGTEGENSYGPDPRP